ncbi:hypothetical protein ACFCYN_18855 [Gottfriedia sp. NPDC056225]|uniref:hypothetical protein n=1 Tax=Gottfriedia sp. NPDC056225 TaxID=3345751 RepID=UPI0035E117B8
MKRLDIFLMLLVFLISTMVFPFLQGKIKTNYIILIVVTFGLGVGLISRYVTERNKK